MNLERIVAEVDLRQIRSNLDVLLKTARSSTPLLRGAVAMVKANAYGHGLVGVSRGIEKSKGCLALGVTTLDEGVALREGGCRKPIWVFSGSAPWTELTARAVEKYRLTPVIYSLQDLRQLIKPRHLRAVRSQGFHLKFNTGMNRLGLELSDLAEVRRLIERGGELPSGLCTHFACADNLSHSLTQAQVGAFEEVLANAPRREGAYIHCANTSAILAGRRLATSRACNVVRPGLGLYGYHEGPHGKYLRTRPALKLRARVLAARELVAGCTVGYGATYRARGGEPEAVVALGYGDGLFRVLSNRSLLIAHPTKGTSTGKLARAAVLGRVSMDMVALGMKAKPGNWVTLLGASPRQGYEMAEAAGTIIYEILTSISARVPRVFRA